MASKTWQTTQDIQNKSSWINIHWLGLLCPYSDLTSLLVQVRLDVLQSHQGAPPAETSWDQDIKQVKAAFAQPADMNLLSNFHRFFIVMSEEVKGLVRLHRFSPINSEVKYWEEKHTQRSWNQWVLKLMLPNQFSQSSVAKESRLVDLHIKTPHSLKHKIFFTKDILNSTIWSCLQTNLQSHC